MGQSLAERISSLSARGNITSLQNHTQSAFHTIL